MAVNFDAELINCDHVLMKTRIFTKKCLGCKKRKWPWSKAVGCIKCMKVWHRRCQPVVVKPLTILLAIPEPSAADGQSPIPVVEPLNGEPLVLVVESLAIPVPSTADGKPSAVSVAMTANGHFAYRSCQRSCHVVIDPSMTLKIGGELLRAVPLCLWLNVSHPVKENHKPQLWNPWPHPGRQLQTENHRRNLRAAVAHGYFAKTVAVCVAEKLRLPKQLT